jgi:hypothetical protein
MPGIRTPMNAIMAFLAPSLDDIAQATVMSAIGT